MSAAILLWSVTVAQAMLVAAVACYTYRLIRGPRAQDRVLCLDAVYVSAMLLVLTVGIRAASQIYFEAALIIAVLSNGLILVGVSDIWQYIIKGLVIIVAVALDRYRAKGLSRT